MAPRDLSPTQTMRSRSSKFYPRSLTLLVSILELIKQGTIASDIAKQLNMKKSHVSYYFTKARNLGYLKKVTRDAFTLIELTQAGKNLLDQYTQNNISIPVCRLENIQFKAKVLQMPTIPVDWKKIEMHNWTQYTSQIDGVHVRLNDGSVPSLVFLPSPVEGDDPFQLYTVMVIACVNVMLELNDKFGLRVGPLELGSRGEWLVYDPVAKSFCKNTGHGQVTYDGIGKVNASPPRHIGEFEFHDPRALLDYLEMPKRLQNIEKMLERMTSVSQ
jgi:DNA-binding MarR family transcriptional regulator